MKWTTACATVVAGMAAMAAQTAHPAPLNVTAVRHWNAAGATRIAIEVSGDFEYRGDHLQNPERVYFDILNARPKFDNKRLYTEDVEDPFVKRIRVAETSPGVTRVVFDLTGPVEVNASVLSSPDRLMVELRHGALATDPASPPSVSIPANLPPQLPAPLASQPMMAPAPAPAAKSSAAAPVKSVASDTPLRSPATVPPAAPVKSVAGDTPVKSPASVPPAAPVKSGAGDMAVKSPATVTPAAPVKSGAADMPVPAMESESTATRPASAPPAVAPAVIPKPARRTSTGETSLVRALGLKLQRIVIDPGHGGHDEGTQGPKGLLEKDLVLDVSLRLGKMIEEKMGAEVIYTRADDTFMPLTSRTELANEKKADLFLSIHANSSPTPRITGVETYYLNVTDAKEAMEVASRENAGADKTIFELRDLIQKISLHDKASESRDFADRIQSALFAFSSKTFTAEKNRGVKKAPFVVLIGANMPSVLAEIGFVSNAREEALLKKPDYRQKLAEALYRGVSKYAESLSHFQVAVAN